MKKFSIFLIAFFLPLSLFLSGFTTSQVEKNDPPSSTGENQTLVEFVAANRNFVNTDAAPALIANLAGSGIS